MGKRTIHYSFYEKLGILIKNGIDSTTGVVIARVLDDFTFIMLDDLARAISEIT